MLNPALLIKKVAPKWSIEPADTNVVRGSSVSVDCVASGFPPPRIIWTKAGSELPAPAAGGAASGQGANQAQSTPTNSSSAKQLHNNHLGAWVSLLLLLLHLKVHQQTAPNHSVHLQRSIVSSPHLQVHENGSLSIVEARDSDFGHYMCQAANGVGPGLSKVIKLTVNGKFASTHLSSSNYLPFVPRRFLGAVKDASFSGAPNEAA